MAFRNDLESALARAAALEREVASLRRQLEQRRRSEAAKQDTRLDELERGLGAAVDRLQEVAREVARGASSQRELAAELARVGRARVGRASGEAGGSPGPQQLPVLWEVNKQCAALGRMEGRGVGVGCPRCAAEGVTSELWDGAALVSWPGGDGSPAVPAVCPRCLFLGLIARGLTR